MIVARQFIAWCVGRTTAVPLGYGAMGFEERGGATMASPVARLGIPGQRSYRPYGTDPFSTQFQAINCLATITQSLRDAPSPIRCLAPSPLSPSTTPPLQYSKTPSLRVAGFEDSLPDVASRLVRHSLPEFRTTGRRRKFQTTRRSREDDCRSPNSFLQTPPTRVHSLDAREPSAHCFQYFGVHRLNSGAGCLAW
jgi:hypothetical protein